MEQGVMSAAASSEHVSLQIVQQAWYEQTHMDTVCSHTMIMFRIHARKYASVKRMRCVFLWVSEFLAKVPGQGVCVKGDGSQGLERGKTWVHGLVFPKWRWIMTAAEVCAATGQLSCARSSLNSLQNHSYSKADGLYYICIYQWYKSYQF